MSHNPSDSNPIRHLIIGLDAAEWTLIRRWVDDGLLPTFKRLLEGGTHGVLSTSANALPDTVWSCIYGGRNPATFEKYFYVQYDPQSGDLRHVADDSFTKRSFWQLLGEAGIEVGVVDAVKLPLRAPQGGFQIVNWGTHAAKSAPASSPPGLLDEVIRRFGKHPVGDVDAMDNNTRSQRDIRRRLLTGVRMRGDMNRWLMTERGWDVYFACFAELHQVGHFFWHLMDDQHPLHPKSDPHGLRHVMQEVYSAVDDEIGRMIETAGDDARVLIFSGHGMGPLCHASWNLGQMLELWGFGRNPPSKAKALKKARVNPWRILKMILPGRFQYAVKAMLPQSVQDELLFRWYAGRRNWSGCKAFAVPNNDSAGAVRINLKGRDRFGVVEPDDYASLRGQIMEAVSELTDPVTGRSVVREIVPLHDVYRGPFLDNLPDVTVLWDNSFAWSAVSSPRFGELTLTNQDSRSGTHTPVGFFVAGGPGIGVGREISGHSIYDLAPSILQLAGVEPPANLDGTAMALLSDSSTSIGA